MKGWDRKDRDWDYISFFFRENTAVNDPGVIDDKTWADLDLGDVFRLIDRTSSSVGQALLYRLMRSPLSTPEEFAERAAKIRALMQDEAGRRKLARVLSKPGFQREGEIFSFLSFMSTRIKDGNRYLFLLMSFAAALSAAALAFFGVRALLFFAAITITNFIIHFRYKATVQAESPSFGYLHRLLRAAGRLAGLEVPAVGTELAKLRALLPGLRKFSRKTLALSPRSSASGDMAEAIFEYIRIFLLIDVTTYFFVHNEAIRLMESLKSVYSLVGTIDALAAVAAYRKENTSCITPEISSSLRSLDAEDLTHPLLPEPVPNTVRMDGRGVIVTGSNMSGKSTFLRALGVNQVLATTVCTAFAGRFRASLFHTITSITNRDDISKAESHYFAEAKRMLAILRGIEASRPRLVIIDEILAGTNSRERIAASVRILKYMANRNCLVVAATHDREIAAALEDLYVNRHFTHFIDQKGIEFDYRLKEGIVEHGNAITLLGFLGFPKEIIGDG
jgi:hypothetical protein